MKNNVCLLLILSVLLASCSVSETEETAVVPVETAVITEATTMTETGPRNLFEAQGYELWEGVSYYEGNGTIGNDDNAISMKITTGELNNIGNDVLVYTGKISEFSESTAHFSELIPGTVTIRVYEYTSNTFESTWLADRVDVFYKAYQEKNGDQISKALWLEKHQDYVIREIHLQIDVASEQYFQSIKSKLSNFLRGLTIKNVGIVDMRTNTLYYSPDQGNTMVEFTVDTDTGEKCIYAYQDHYLCDDNHRISGSAGYEAFGNQHWNMFAYVLVPSEYDELAFAWAAPRRARTTEEWMEHILREDSQDWGVSDLTGAMKADSRNHYYFFQ